LLVKIKTDAPDPVLADPPQTPAVSAGVGACRVRGSPRGGGSGPGAEHPSHRCARVPSVQSTGNPSAWGSCLCWAGQKGIRSRLCYILGFLIVTKCRAESTVPAAGARSGFHLN